MSSAIKKSNESCTFLFLDRLSLLMARPSTLLESKSWCDHDCGKTKHQLKPSPLKFWFNMVMMLFATWWCTVKIHNFFGSKFFAINCLCQSKSTILHYLGCMTLVLASEEKAVGKTKTTFSFILLSFPLTAKLAQCHCSRRHRCRRHRRQDTPHSRPNRSKM